MSEPHIVLGNNQPNGTTIWGKRCPQNRFSDFHLAIGFFKGKNLKTVFDKPFPIEKVMVATHVQFYRQFYKIKPRLSVKTLRVVGKSDILHELIEV